jgi:hypothetical protein
MYKHVPIYYLRNNRPVFLRQGRGCRVVRYLNA